MLDDTLRVVQSREGPQEEGYRPQCVSGHGYPEYSKQLAEKHGCEVDEEVHVNI